jgi:hypothetical protein
MNWGITTEYAIAETKRRLMKNPIYADLHKKVLAVVKEKGYTDFEIFKRNKHRDQYFVLSGIKPLPEGEMDSTVLDWYTDKNYTTVVDGYIKLLESYLHHLDST